MNSFVMFVLLLGLAAFKEEVPKPNLSQVCLVFVCSIYFLDSIEDLGLEVKTFPNLRKSSSS